MPLHPQASVRPQTAQVHLPGYTPSPPRWAAGVAPITPLSARAQQARAVGFTRSPTSTGGGRLLTRNVQSARPSKSERCFSPGSPTRVVTPLSTPPRPSSCLALPRRPIVPEHHSAHHSAGAHARLALQDCLRLEGVSNLWTPRSACR